MTFTDFDFKKFTGFTVKHLWEKLGDIPIDEDECIEEQFLHFQVGTHREEIWHWFEDQFDISVTELMYGKNKDG